MPRQTLILRADPNTYPEVSPISPQLTLWQRQFGPHATRGQKFFDLLAGAVLPVLCIWLDPAVFTGAETGLGGMFNEVAVFAYIFILVEIAVLLLSLLLAHRLGVLRGFLGGMLAVGAGFAGFLGLVLLPLSFLSLFLLVFIGGLGLSPLATSFVFLRNSIRALRRSDAAAGGAIHWFGALLGAVLAIGVPGATQWEANHLVGQLAQVSEEDESQVHTPEIECARWMVRWFGVQIVDPLVDAYDREENPAAKKRIATTYHTITGGDVDFQLTRLRD